MRRHIRSGSRCTFVRLARFVYKFLSIGNILFIELIPPRLGDRPESKFPGFFDFWRDWFVRRAGRLALPGPVVKKRVSLLDGRERNQRVTPAFWDVPRVVLVVRGECDVLDKY